MQATITFLLTESAQRSQMAATGQPAARKQVRTVEITPEQLPLLAMAEDGTPYLDISRPLGELFKEGAYSKSLTKANLAAARALGHWRGYVSAETTDLVLIDDANADILALIEAAHAERKAKEDAEQREQAERKILEHANGEYNREQTEIAFQAFLADPTARIGATYSVSHKVDTRSPADWWPREHQAFAAEVRRRNELDAAAKQAAASAMEQAKSQAIAAFVAASGDTLLQEQFAADLLCRKTIISHMANAALDAAGLPAECPDSVVCDDRDCPCDDKTLDCIPPAVYARWKAIGPLPEDANVEFRAVRNCLQNDEDQNQYDNDAETAAPLEYHALVTIPSGPFQFKRRIKV